MRLWLKTKDELIEALAFVTVLFWACWFLIVSATDFANLLQTLHILPTKFPFSSGNFKLIYQSLGQFHLNYNYPAIVIYSIIILVAIITALCYWIAIFNFKVNKERYLKFCYLAYLISISMTEFFILCDEFFIEYNFGHNHVIRLAFQLINLILFYLFTQKADVLEE